VSTDIASELSKNRLYKYPSIADLPDHYTAFPLGLTDKSDGSKRRIHHLSYPPDSPQSINGGIPEEYGTITYSSIDDAIHAVQLLGPNCVLIKRDFESAFRHIPVSPLDSPLLGFYWGKRYYAELFLPFGLRTAPYLFNLFAEVFQWILEQELNKKSIEVHIIHYLDDFLLVLPPSTMLEQCSQTFKRLCEEVGLAIKEAKNEEGNIASFAGVEIDTQRMVIKLPKKKLEKAKSLVLGTLARRSATLLELQQITGYLNFVSTVVPLGRTFLRRLYNMELHFPPGGRYQRRGLSTEAQKDLAWWEEVLTRAPKRSIAVRVRKSISCWSDASSTKGLGAFYTCEKQPEPQADSAFTIPLPKNLSLRKEHINTQEMRAVEQALLRWGQRWKGKRVLLHTDNQTVAYGIANGTTRGSPMQVLRRCLLLAIEWDLEIEARWIPTKENTLVDALSRFDRDKIADLAPQVIQTVNHQQLGFRIFSKQDSPLPPLTAFGGA